MKLFGDMCTIRRVQPLQQTPNYHPGIQVNVLQKKGFRVQQLRRNEVYYNYFTMHAAYIKHCMNVILYIVQCVRIIMQKRLLAS